MPSPHVPVGTVYLVGAGPGDPGLLTVRGRALLDGCDAIVHDALANPALLPEESREGRGGPTLYSVGKRGHDVASAKQEEINALLVRLAREGKRVVRLKGGDPFVFGRGSEEAQALVAANIPFEVVPGVTAGIAAPAYAGIPLTHRGLAAAATFVSGHEDPSKPDSQIDWTALAQVGGTIVLYMGVATLRGIADALVAGGLRSETPAAAIEWGTHPQQRTVTATLGTLADAVASAELGAPLITIIGDVVPLREHIAWFDRRPLHGRRVVVTRATAQASSLADALSRLGAEVLTMPATRIEPMDSGPLRAAIERLDDYDWLIFTSQNGVLQFWSTLRASGRDARALAGSRVCAVGPATAEALHARGLAVDCTPERFVAEGVVEALGAGGEMAGRRVLYAASEGARSALAEGLRALGATVDVIPVYRSVGDEEGLRRVRETLATTAVDLVTFTSASAVHAYVDAVGEETAHRSPAVSIGPITSDALRAAGIPIAVEAGDSTIAGLVRSITNWAGTRA